MPKTTLGMLRDTLVIQQKSKTPDSQGGRAVAWVTLATVPGSVRATGGAEQLQAGAVSSRVQYEGEIVYRPDVMPSMRALWTPFGGTQKTLEIGTVRPKDGRADRLLLDCVEVA